MKEKWNKFWYEHTYHKRIKFGFLSYQRHMVKRFRWYRLIIVILIIFCLGFVMFKKF